MAKERKKLVVKGDDRRYLLIRLFYDCSLWGVLMQVALICGGPSAERGISLNSARSIMDHLSPLGWDIVPLYCGPDRGFYRLSPAQLYSNTPSDFDYKLAQTAQPLSKVQFIAVCREVDMVLPAIHGSFGEDGELQEWLEENGIPFIGSPSSACRLMFDKDTANRHLARHGFSTLPNCCIELSDAPEKRIEKAEDFFRRFHIQKAVVKPSAGGSSLGVATASTPRETVARSQDIFDQGHDTRALVEPYCEGREFTVVVLQNVQGDPVALVPVEIDLIGGDLFTFRHKYLPTCHVEYHCPPRFDDETVARIQKAAEVLFTFFGMRDFARLDGWLLDDGRVIFSDFNPISGMEQNSYLFIQGSRIGFTHAELLHHIVSCAASRYGVALPLYRGGRVKESAKRVRVLFGGVTAERQVSLMSGTNVWLKLMASKHYNPQPYLLMGDQVWELPYSFTLNHTVEEIQQRCLKSSDILQRLEKIVPPIRHRLGLPSMDVADNARPRLMDLPQFCQEAKDDDAFVFIALHGGMGEDGTLQAIFNQYGLAYNGSDADASFLCMDKNATGRVIQSLHDPRLTAAEKVPFSIGAMPEAAHLWEEAVAKFGGQNILIKPQSDGCSAGVVRLHSAGDLAAYIQAVAQRKAVLPSGTLLHQPHVIELPTHVDKFILEPYIETDELRVCGDRLEYAKKQGWIELTVGVLEEAGNYHALMPSITIARHAVLSLEEKFQGGTGINLTPPPVGLIGPGQIALIREKAEYAAQALGIEGYARLDVFFNRIHEQVLLIEANSLPGLTPSTVIYHQALAEVPAMNPAQFLERLIALGIRRHSRLKEEAVRSSGLLR